MTATDNLTLLYGGSLSVNLGAISNVTGGTLALFTLAGNSASGFTTQTANVNGIIGGYLTLNGTDWASANGPGLIGAPTYTANTWSATANVTVTTNSTQTNATTNSLRFAAAADTVTIAGIGTIASGGILVSSAVGNHLSKITGGASHRRCWARAVYQSMESE